MNEAMLSGGEPAERERAAAILVAGERGCEPLDGEDIERLPDGSLRLRFWSLEATGEDEVLLLAAQFPELDILLLYLSPDGEFCGLLRARGEGRLEASLDLPEGMGAGLEGLPDEELLRRARELLAGEAGLA